MPTQEQMDAVIVDIEGTLSEHPGSRTMQFLQMQEREWTGFHRDEQLMVIGRVIGFEPRDRWMEALNEK